jgi:Cytochrome c554 and c-prime
MVNASHAPAGRKGKVHHSTLDSGWHHARSLTSTALLAACVAVSACSSPDGDKHATLDIEKLKDPATCKECHQQHYREWSASMHAYASKDPVFEAMNRRGQEETAGALGNFCVKCHAPMAVEEGKTTDGLNLAELPDSLHGVTCYFCHNAVAVEGTHNNPIRLALDTTMRGSFQDPPPAANSVHGSAYSRFMSGSTPESARLCGACHDIVLPSPPAPPPRDGRPVELERTFSEWQQSVFSFDGDGGNIGLSCSGVCHMPPSPAPFQARGPAAEKAGLVVGPRDLHEHLFPGADVALTPFPVTGDANDDAFLESHHRSRIQFSLNNTVQVKEICVQEADETHVRLTVQLENIGAGHFWPSGASHDRRAWVEVKAYLDGNLVYASGAVAPGEDVTTLGDPDLWLFRDELRGIGDKEPHMFWDIAESIPRMLPAPITRNPGLEDFYKNHRTREFPLARSQTIAAPLDRKRLRVTVLIRLQPMGFDVLDDLIASGHLDPGVRNKMPIFNLYPNLNHAINPAVVRAMPELGRLAEVSFEWSEAIRSSGFFSAVIKSAGDCMVMKSAPR